MKAAVKVEGTSRRGQLLAAMLKDPQNSNHSTDLFREAFNERHNGNVIKGQGFATSPKKSDLPGSLRKFTGDNRSWITQMETQSSYLALPREVEQEWRDLSLSLCFLHLFHEKLKKTIEEVRDEFSGFHVSRATPQMKWSLIFCFFSWFVLCNVKFLK